MTATKNSQSPIPVASFPPSQAWRGRDAHAPRRLRGATLRLSTAYHGRGSAASATACLLSALLLTAEITFLRVRRLHHNFRIVLLLQA